MSRDEMEMQFASTTGHGQKETGVALLIRHRGHCEPLWAVVPPLQVVLSSACSVASLGRFPSHYLPGRLCLRPGVLADHPFGWGIPSTRQAGHETVHGAPSIKSPFRAQGGMTLPNRKRCLRLCVALTARKTGKPVDGSLFKPRGIL